MGEQDKAKSNQRADKKYKPRDKDPVKLVMQRGSNVVVKRFEVLDEETGEQARDEDGLLMFEMRGVPRPQGVVLAPVQTMVLAGWMHSKLKQIEALTEILRMYEMDEDIPSKTLGPTEVPTESAQESAPDAVDDYEDANQED